MSQGGKPLSALSHLKHRRKTSLAGLWWTGADSERGSQGLGFISNHSGSHLCLMRGTDPLSILASMRDGYYWEWEGSQDVVAEGWEWSDGGLDWIYSNGDVRSGFKINFEIGVDSTCW